MKWTLAEKVDPHNAREIAADLGIPNIIAQILVNRGISEKEDIKRFFYPKQEHLSDPRKLPGMDKAVNRILEGLARREKMIIFGDYDVDGITATALLYLVLSRFGADVTWYLPDRVEEGYGLSRQGIDEAIESGITLLISVDCGITGVEEVEYAKTKGLDCIITDHHEPADDLPDAVALVNPKLAENNPETRELAGVGVAFKFAEAIYDELGEEKSSLYEHLDLVGLGTVADIVPLTGENRIMAKFGIRQLGATQKPGLKSLLRITGLWGKELFSWNIVFVLAPRLNAVGRIGSASSAFELLTTFDRVRAAQTARFLDSENEKRKKLDERIFDEALDRVKITQDLENSRAIVLNGEDWHLGVIGIVASRLVEKYHRPAVLISTAEGIGQGSARSIPGFHLLEAIKDCSDNLTKYGGHKYAAGLCIESEKIDKFREEFLKVANERLTDEDMIPSIQIDAKLDADDINMETLNWLNLFTPYGPKNMRPIFMLENADILRPTKIVGSNHLRFRVRNSKKAYDVIGFGFGDWRDKIENTDEPVNLVFVMETNTYYGYPQLQLRLKDIKIGELDY